MDRDRYVVAKACPDHIRLQYALSGYPDELPGGQQAFARELRNWVSVTNVGKIINVNLKDPNDIFASEIAKLNTVLYRARPECSGLAVASSAISTAEIQGIFCQDSLINHPDGGVLRLIASPYLVLDPEHDELNESIAKNCGVFDEGGNFIPVLSGVTLSPR